VKNVSISVFIYKGQTVRFTEKCHI